MKAQRKMSEITEQSMLRWITSLAGVTIGTIASDASANIVPLPNMLQRFLDTARHRLTERGGRFILLGNGGSLAIAMHIATDFALAGWPSLALCDPVALTSHTNDYGAHRNFQVQLDLLRLAPDDVVIALSCSGRSRNILEAVAFAKGHGCDVVTFSGFEPDNPLRLHGHLNFYTPAHAYGTVQLAHEGLLHMLADLKHGL